MATGVINFNDGFKDTPGFFLGFATLQRTASASGVGGSSSTRLVVARRTASASGTGSSTAVKLRVALRTATGSGTGTQTASANPVQMRTATGSGVGFGTTTRIVVAKRTATGSGVGSGTASSIELLPRTATGSGAATAGSTAIGLRIVPKTATGSGTGTQSATQTQLYLFRPPTDNLVRWADFNGSGIEHALFKFYVPGARGRNVYKLTNGTYSENDQSDPTVVDTTYYGGHDNLVNSTERDSLVAAGYGDYVS